MLMYSIVVTAFSILVLFALMIILHREGYIFKILGKLGLTEYKQKINWAVFSWNSMIEKLNIEADIVFFGDSIIRGSNFHQRYPNKRIINLGFSGDTLAGMFGRVKMIKTVNPKQIFILGGINGLTNMNIDKSLMTYSRLLKEIKKEIPDATIYVQSLLPISKMKEKKICKNKTIIQFNNLLAELAKEYGATYLDLHSLYFKDCYIDPELTVDGIHLQSFAYDRWGDVLDNYIDS